MAFAKKMMGFPSDLVSFPIKLPSKRHENSVSHFFTGEVHEKKSVKYKKYAYVIDSMPFKKTGCLLFFTLIQIIQIL